jgi:hypothetical protein
VLERFNVELTVHEQRAMELLAHGLHVGLFQDKLAGLKTAECIAS